jgi:hypothetical protein
MRRHHHPDEFHDEDLDRDNDEDEDPEELGTPVYQGTGLSVRALTAEQLQQFLDAHQGQPAELLGSGWTGLDPSGHPLVGPRTPPAAPLVAAAGLLGQVLASRAGLPWAGLVGLAVATLVAWRLRYRPSERVTAWRRGADGERRTARLLDRLTRDGYVVFHDLALPGSPANVDHLVIGPSGVFVIDSKQWTGSVRQGVDGLVWHNHYRLDRTLETVRWEAQLVGRLLGARTAALVCVHGAQVHGGGLDAQGVAIVPAHLLRSALGYDRVLSDGDIELLATTARTSLRPAA